MDLRILRAGGAALLCALALAGCSSNDVNQTLNADASAAPASQLAPTRAVQRPTATPRAVQSTALVPDSAGGQANPATLQQATPLPDTALQALSEQEQVVANVYTRVSPAVVRILTGQGLGSGFLIDTQGHIITNNHVVASAQGNQVRVSFNGLFETIGQIVGTDPDSDIAVVKVDELPQGVQPVELGDSGNLRIGQITIAIGNPLQQDRTVTTGIVSALGRTIEEEQGGFAIGGAIQTDAAINPGNSGGPLLDTKGRVIGMNTAILSQSGTSSGIGFAVPVNLIKKVAPAIIQQGSYQHPFLGVSMRQVTTLDARQNNLPIAGILITPSQSGTSPAAQAGLRGDAIMTTINGQIVTSPDDVITYLELNTRPGDTVTLALTDGSGRQQDLQVRLGARPSAQRQQ